MSASKSTRQAGAKKLERSAANDREPIDDSLYHLRKVMKSWDDFFAPKRRSAATKY